MPRLGGEEKNPPARASTPGRRRRAILTTHSSSMVAVRIAIGRSRRKANDGRASLPRVRGRVPHRSRGSGSRNTWVPISSRQEKAS